MKALAPEKQKVQAEYWPDATARASHPCYKRSPWPRSWWQTRGITAPVSFWPDKVMRFEPTFPSPSEVVEIGAGKKMQRLRCTGTAAESAATVAGLFCVAEARRPNAP
jgi:hypothetical protein